ncbi:hypothetical protein D3C80_432200 [compost metagenome]
MLGHLVGKLQVFHLGRRRGALGHDLQLDILDHAAIAALDQKAAGNRFCGNAARPRVRQAACHEQAQVRLFGNDRLCLFGHFRRDDDFGEQLDDLFRRLTIEKLVERNDAAEGRGAVAGQCPQISVLQRRAGGNAAGIGVLDDRAGRALIGRKLTDQLEGAVRVVDVIVGKLLALQQLSCRNTRTVLARHVETGALMRIFAVTHGFLQHAADRPVSRRLDFERFGKPVGNRRVIGRGASIGLGSQLLAESIFRLAAIGLQCLDQQRIIGRIGDDRNIGVVLGRSTDHRRTTDIDVFDRRRIVAAGSTHFLERVEVDDGKIDALDAMLLHRRDMFLVVTD